MSLSIDPDPPAAAGGSGLPSPATGSTGSTGSGAGIVGSVAPSAPGRLGSPLGPQEAFAYLRDLGVWRDKRKEELGGLDSAALAATDRDMFSRDMLVSMALWKAISDRYDLLVVTFDSGRVGPTEAARLSTLIWGRLDVTPGSAADSIAPTTSGALGLSLPEACRLSDAMASSLRARLSLEPSGAEVGTRLKDVRATLERIRDQVGMAPAGDRDAARTMLVRLEQRLADITERAKRGADVGGLLAPLEYEAASSERDLIVGAGKRMESARDAQRAREQVEELAARAEAVKALVSRCVATVSPAPKFGVPDVRSLGPVPVDPAGLTAYLTRLDAVSRALTQVHTAYGDPLAQREEIIGYAGALAAQSRAAGVTDPDLEHLRSRLDAVLTTLPTELPRARALLAAYQAYVTAISPGTGATKGAPSR